MKIILTTAIVAIAAAIGYILAIRQIGSRDFKCVHCSHVFRPRLTKLAFAMHSDDYYELTCPECGEKGALQQ